MSEKGNQAVKTVSFMMLITLFGKILGMVREQLLAANYGTDMQAAAFLLASRIPRTFFDVIFASAISASFIPVFVEYLQKKGRQEAFSLANRFITMISTVTLLMMLLGMAFAKPLTLLIAPGYDVETVTLCVGLLRMLFPTMLFTAVAFSFVGILQSLEEFNVPAALSVVSNGVLILYYIFFNEKFGILGLTAAFLIGWAMQAVIQIPSLWKKGYHYHPDFHFKDEGLRKIGKLMLPVMVSTWIQPINFMVNTRFASQLSGGSAVNGELGVSALEYANNLYTDNDVRSYGINADTHQIGTFDEDMSGMEVIVVWDNQGFNANSRLIDQIYSVEKDTTVDDTDITPQLTLGTAGTNSVPAIDMSIDEENNTGSVQVAYNADTVRLVLNYPTGAGINKVTMSVNDVDKTASLSGGNGQYYVDYTITASDLQRGKITVTLTSSKDNGATNVTAEYTINVTGTLIQH